MLRHTTLLAISFLGLAAQAQAQAIYAERPAQAMPFPYNQSYSSTLQEGVQHGFADVLRADGSRTYDLSLAAGHFEDARAKWLKNRQEGVQKYFELRLMNQSYRRALAGKPAAKSTTTNSQAKVSRPATAASPAPVLANGQIEWPVALQRSATAGARKQLQYVFSLRASGRDTRPGTPEYRQGSEALSQIGADLQTTVRTLSTPEYLAAKKLLQALKQELAQPIQQPLLTQN